MSCKNTLLCIRHSPSGESLLRVPLHRPQDTLSCRYSLKLLDEPFKFLSKNLLPRASELLKELSEKLDLQFIMVTHLDELTDCADKTFDVKIKKGVSKVT
jgi:DNA repair exonuclease SbcCD ATPase subunit|tara:strand:- start:1314 stop:1613 length:300 start_codon:yes stop_codon:yes gene_type:complete